MRLSCRPWTSHSSSLIPSPYSDCGHRKPAPSPTIRRSTIRSICLPVPPLPDSFPHAYFFTPMTATTPPTCHTFPLLHVPCRTSPPCREFPLRDTKPFLSMLSSRSLLRAL